MPPTAGLRFGIARLPGEGKGLKGERGRRRVPPALP